MKANKNGLSGSPGMLKALQGSNLGKVLLLGGMVVSKVRGLRNNIIIACPEVLYKILSSYM